MSTSISGQTSCTSTPAPKYLVANDKGSPQWSKDVLLNLGLSSLQVLRALEALEYVGAIRPGGRYDYSGGAVVWMMHVTPQGRRLANGTASTASTFTPTLVINDIKDSYVANAGVCHGPVTLTVNTFPPIPEDVREALSKMEEGNAYAEALEDELRRPQARVGLLRTFLNGIKTTITMANVATEVAEHGQQWLTEAFDWVATTF